MARHTIMLPDRSAGRDLRSIVWDDEAGTVSGDHSKLPWLAEQIKAEAGWLEMDTQRVWLEDPAHRPGDLLWLLGYIWQGVHGPGEDFQGITVTLPPVFDGGPTTAERAGAMITGPDGTSGLCAGNIITEDGTEIAFPPDAAYTITEERGPHGGLLTTDGHEIYIGLF